MTDDTSTTGTKQTVTLPREELQLIVDLAMVARKTDDGRVAPMIGGSARSTAARRATDKYARLLREQRSQGSDT
jgi:hypothetical protein